ncbi:beta-ketoacyl-ACP synthase II [Candidatus Sneabacter namystus]|uniref:3-oxoacyl-[acyl-carrier-protein] synthase 2 n=1 Tax=Candidatus Sneabacter namystus TaxID=2601646 RepID=A0A5C0ULP0_9RICK|nr:beta-ketoacyl-ACP synthase II [Candidatus Sneabacter namystus]QEK39794.1 beta-ketoacyl-ACP synthase II [Candidatus Sneabacter namystus]
MKERRIAITGVGMVTPLGRDARTTWDSILNCKSGIRQIKSFDASRHNCRIAGEIDNELLQFTPEGCIAERDLKKMGRFMQFGFGATHEAIIDSGINLLEDNKKDSIGVYLGSGIGGLGNIEEASVEFNKGKNISPFFIPSTLINLLAGQVSIKYGFTGPNLSVATACTTGAHAIGEAAKMIRYNEADIMIAGSAEASITPLGVEGFCACKALTTKFNTNPEAASRPWDVNRSGFVMSEGAGVVILEELQHAKNRNANIYAELTGYGTSGDGYHYTSPHPEGKGALSCMNKALKDANIHPQDIDYVNAHGTSTQVGDKIELVAVQDLLFAANSKLVMSSTKSSLGHMLGAAGSVEIALCVLAMRDSVAPPTINLDQQISEVKMNLARNAPHEKRMHYIISNSFGFGGTNASIVIKSV